MKRPGAYLVRQGIVDPWWYVVDKRSGQWVDGPFTLKSEAEERMHALQEQP